MTKHDTGDLDTGYVLFTPMLSKTTYLIDKCGKLLHTWQSKYTPNYSVYLLEDGCILRPGTIGNPTMVGGGIIEKIDWDGNIIFSYTVSSATEIQHHDIEPLPNGNILAVVWEKKTSQEAIEAGKNPNFLGQYLMPDKIIEIQPIDKYTYNIVWEWHAWDHLVQRYDSNMANYGLVKDHPELIDINFIRRVQSDMFHINAVDYNADFDQILLSCHSYDEIWIIDHSTTTAEAASHSGGIYGKGGDLLYRWGNPYAYKQGTVSDQKLFGQHDAKWIESTSRGIGSIMVFNNGFGRPGGVKYSSVDIINTPVDASGEYESSIPFAPTSQSWIYNAAKPEDFYSQLISGAQKLPNGNILICSGNSGTFFEIDTLGNTVWEYINPVGPDSPYEQGVALPIANNVFRCTFYPANYAGLSGHSLVHSNPIELNPLPYICHLEAGIGELPQNQSNLEIYQNKGIINVAIPFNNYSLRAVNMMGQKVFSGQNINQINVSDFLQGVYVIIINTSDGKEFTKKIFIDNSLQFCL